VCPHPLYTTADHREIGYNDRDCNVLNYDCRWHLCFCCDETLELVTKTKNESQDESEWVGEKMDGRLSGIPGVSVQMSG
jgi:hypothetical protein